MRRALAGVRIIDFSWQYTGPIVTRFLAACGAEVIKIESPDRPDGARAYSPYKDNKPGPNRSTVFANYNSDKYSITLNLRNKKAVEIAKRLVARADVVVESYRPGVMKRLGLGYEELKAAKPDMIYVSMSMQGQTGPLSHQLALGFYFQGAIGVTHLTGWPDRDPVGTPFAYPDYITPWYMLVAIMAGLDYRRRKQKGLYIDISQLESSLQFFAPTLLDYTANGRIQTRMGNRSSVAPHGVYRCKGDNRWCAIAVFTDRQWQELCRVIGSPEWVKDVKFATLAGRLANQDELDRNIEDWTAQHSAEEVMAKMQASGIAAGVIENGQDVLENDPQLQHRGHFKVVDHPEIGSHLCEDLPARFSRTPTELRMPAPCLGQHNEYVCTQILRMPDKDFVELVSEGVFG